MLCTLHSSYLLIGTDFSKATVDPSQDTWYCNICTPHKGAAQKAMSRTDVQCHEQSYAHKRQAKLQAEKEVQAWLPPGGDAAAWDIPEDQNTAWDIYGRVDKMSDYIPFWRDGIQAAERGEEVAKMEDFMERLDREIRERNRSANTNQWGKDLGLDMWGGGDTSPNAWGAQDQEKPSWEAAEQWDGPESGWGDSSVANGWAVAGGDAWDNAGGWGVVPDKEPMSGPDPTGWASTATESSGKPQSPSADKSHDDDNLGVFVEKVVQEEAASPAKSEQLRKFSQVCHNLLQCSRADSINCISFQQKRKCGEFRTSRGSCAHRPEPMKAPSTAMFTKSRPENDTQPTTTSTATHTYRIRVPFCSTSHIWSIFTYQAYNLLSLYVRYTTLPNSDLFFNARNRAPVMQ